MCNRNILVWIFVSINLILLLGCSTSEEEWLNGRSIVEIEVEAVGDPVLADAEGDYWVWRQEIMILSVDDLRDEPRYLETKAFFYKDIPELKDTIFNRIKSGVRFTVIVDKRALSGDRSYWKDLYEWRNHWTYGSDFLLIL